MVFKQNDVDIVTFLSQGLCVPICSAWRASGGLTRRNRPGGPHKAYALSMSADKIDRRQPLNAAATARLAPAAHPHGRRSPAKKSAATQLRHLPPPWTRNLPPLNVAASAPGRASPFRGHPPWPAVTTSAQLQVISWGSTNLSLWPASSSGLPPQLLCIIGSLDIIQITCSYRPWCL